MSAINFHVINTRAWAGTCRAVLIFAAISSCPTDSAWADDLVSFDSARYLVGSLQQRLARERGETIERPPGDTIQGYLSKPQGAGPFPAIVHLHGCNGLTARARTAAAAQMTQWGFVTLAVDSFTSRGLREACVSNPPDRLADAFGALVYLSKLSFVDTRRIALVGYSQGGRAVLQAASSRPFDLFEMPAGLGFKAAVAYYPLCGAAEDEMAIPTLILIGELDDWSPIKPCEWWLERRAGRGAPVNLVVYPEAFHDFDNPGIRNGMDFTHGHWLKYDRATAGQAKDEMRRFLADNLLY